MCTDWRHVDSRVLACVYSFHGAVLSVQLLVCSVFRVVSWCWFLLTKQRSLTCCDLCLCIQGSGTYCCDCGLLWLCPLLTHGAWLRVCTTVDCGLYRFGQRWCLLSQSHAASAGNSSWRCVWLHCARIRSGAALDSSACIVYLGGAVHLCQDQVCTVHMQDMQDISRVLTLTSCLQR